MRAIAIGLAVSILACTPAFAGLVYDNGTPDLKNGFDMTAFREADDFTLASASTIAGISFWSVPANGNFAGSFDGSVTWAVYNDAAGSPGTLVSSATVNSVPFTATGTDVQGNSNFPVFQLDVTLAAPLALSAGTYWLELHEGASLTANDGSPVFWVTSGNGVLKGSSSESALLSALPSSSNASDLAFQLFDASVPEPGSWVLVAGGLLTLLGVSRLRR